MAEDVERRLAAILSADIVGYSRLTGEDEEGTLRRLLELRAELIDPSIKTHRGRIIKTMGDGLLVEFASVVDAVRSSLEVQRGLIKRNADCTPDKRIEFRMGIHIGDVMVQPDGDLLGDSINIAARLQTLAEPASVFLSEDAYRQVRNRLKEDFVDFGDRQFKNIAHTMRVYGLRTGGAKSVGGEGPESATSDVSHRHRERPAHAKALKLPGQIPVRAPGLRIKLKTVQQAIGMIDKNLPTELAGLSRWTFARALLVEAMRTGKSRDVNAAARQLSQALRNERWLEEQDEAEGPVRNSLDARDALRLRSAAL